MQSPRFLVRCCYLGMFIQALVINVTPLLFIPLREEFRLSFEQIGRLVLINFLGQMVVDLVCTALADRVPTKPLVVVANLFAGAGLWVFALAPRLFAVPYYGLVLGTLILAVGCGLLEVLLSPIVNAVPSLRKSGDMALLHAFYPIGKVAVIVVTGGILYIIGSAGWWLVLLAWSGLPFLNALGFSLVRIPPLATDGVRPGWRILFCDPAFPGLLLAMALAGAAEVTVAQWTSAFVEKGLGFAKIVADLAGFALFGVGMIVGRLWFGLRGHQRELDRVMILGAATTTITYLLMSLSPWPILALAACASSGFFVSMLWPGSLSLAAHRFPLAGASMFALLAAAGDAGAAFMPWGVGVIADRTSMQAGLLVAALCPFAMVFVLRGIRSRPLA